MRKALLIALTIGLTGCTAIPPKRTDFYKNGRLVKTIVGRGVFDGNDWFGTYRVWAMNGNSYYEYRCLDCEIVETPIEQRAK